MRDTNTETPTPFRPAVALLETKLRRPVQRVGIVERTRLVERLADRSGPRVVSLVAPPGYGKTSLLAEWVGHRDAPVAWVTVDTLDNDPAVLFSYVAVALDRIRPIDASVAAGLVGPSERVMAVAVPRLCADLYRWPAPAVIVLDDAHLITNATCLDAIATLIDHLPPGFRIAIAGRSEPRLPFARLRAQRDLLEIGADALAMDVDEAAELTVLAGRQLSHGQLERLVARTEGWAAGIYLASLTDAPNELDGPDIPSARTTVGSSRYIADYLRSELGRDLEPEGDFLSRTSILESVSPGAADAVTGMPGAAARLQRIARHNLLVREVAGGASYHYHNLLREYLEAELLQREPDLVPVLHLRASNWYAEAGNVERAIGHAFAAHDVGRAASLLTGAMLPLFHRGQLATVVRLLGGFEPADFERHPSLAVAGAWMHLMSGNGAEAERLADIAERSTLDGPPGDGSATFESQRAMLRAVMCRRGARAMLSDASLAVDAEPPGSPWRSHALFLLGGAHLVQGDLDVADAWCEQAVDLGTRIGATNLAPLACRAVIRIAREDWDGAALFSEQSRTEMIAKRYEGLAQAVLTYAVCARVAVHRGELQAAREDLVRAQLVRPVAQAVPWVSVLALTHLAHAYIGVSDVSGARQAIREAEDLVRRQPLLGSLTADLLVTRKQLEGAITALAGPSSLTAAELRVLLFLPTYLSFEEIGDRLAVSRNTVKSHATSIYGKLFVSSRGEAVERAVELGLLEPYPTLRVAAGRDGHD